MHELYELYKISKKQDVTIFDFVKDPANINLVRDINNGSETVLDLACNDKDYTLVKSLLESPAYADMPEGHKLYLLHKTSEFRDNAIFDYLKHPKNKESIIAINEDKQTVLDLSYQDDNYPLVKSLLELDLYNHLPKIHKLYLLYKTSGNKDKGILDFLKNPANKEFIADLDKNNQTVLHLAAYDDKWELVYLLIELGADINARDKYNRTPLNYCIDCRNVNNINDSLIRLLIARGANINEADARGFTSLHYAVLAGHLIKVDKLTSLGADIDQMTNNLDTPLKLAFTRDIPNKDRVLQLLFNQSDIISQSFINISNQGVTNIIPPPRLTDGVVVIGSTIWDPVLTKYVPVTRATPGFENAITNVDEFRQAAEAAEKEFNDSSKIDIAAKRRYNYKAIEVITRNRKDPEMQALHTVAAMFARRTEPEAKSLKVITGRALARHCIFSIFDDSVKKVDGEVKTFADRIKNFDARLKLEKDMAKYPPDVQEIIEKEIHAIAVGKSTRNQR